MSNNIREVFVVSKTTSYCIEMPMAVGSSSGYPLHGRNEHLFHLTYADQGVKYGDVFFNGNRIDPLYDDFMPGDFATLHVFSVGHQEKFKLLDMISSDRGYVSRVGGCRVAEILYYTNSLTHLERAAVNRYLVGKWLSPKDAPHEEFGYVNLASNDVEVAVEENNRAAVGSLVVRGDKAIKTGGGTLAIGKLFPTNAAVEVRGGTLAFRELPTVDSSAPASDAYLWLDATVEDSLIPQTGRAEEGPEYIEKWKDRRLDRDTPCAVLPGSYSSYYTQNAPWIRRNVAIPGGATRSVVDFGEKTASVTNFTWMRLNKCDSANAFEAYIALRFKSKTDVVNIFGSTEQGMTRNELSMLVSHKFGNWKPVAGLWTVDGVPADPWDGSHNQIDTNRFYVISLSQTRRGNFDLIAKDRSKSGAAGNVEIGEYILYDRRLSDGERRATVDYLMQRWEGRNAPEVNGVTEVKSLVYAADTPVSIESDGLLSVEQISGGNGAYAKGGDGDVDLRSIPGDAAMTSVTVSGGSLSLDFVYVDDSIFHFDALNADSLTYEVTGSVAEGNLKTNVLTWADTRGSSYELATSAKGMTTSVADPTLISVETRPGVFRPCLDFGTIAHSVPTAVDSAGLIMKYSHADVKEAYIVYADTDSSRGGFIFCDSSYYNYHRGYSGAMVHSTYTILTNGTAYVDGVKTNTTSVLPFGFHVIALINPNEEVTHINQLSKDRRGNTMRSGGNRICEALAYNRHLDDAERTYLLQKLQEKWFGEGAALINKSLTSLSVADGASFSAPVLSVTTPTLAGGGNVAVGGISDVSTLSIAYDKSAETFAGITVDGPVSFAETGDLTLEIAASGKVTCGTYTILSADSLGDLDASRFVIDSDISTARLLSLKVEDNKLKLVVRKGGLIMLVK